MSIYYDIHGVNFKLSDRGVSHSFNTFKRGTPEANDTGPYGQVTEMEAFIDRTKDMKCLLDVGACHGAFSIVFTSNVTKSAIAVEPSPWAYPILLEQLMVNPERKITTVNSFVSDKVGDTVKCCKDNYHVVQDNGGGPDWQKKYFGKQFNSERINIKTTTIDSIDAVRNSKIIDCIKIDVEGLECHAIRGAVKTIERFKPLIFLEAHTNTLPAHGESGDSLLSLLAGLGYRFKRFDGTIETTLNDSSMKRLICEPI